MISAFDVNHGEICKGVGTVGSDLARGFGMGAKNFFTGSGHAMGRGVSGLGNKVGSGTLRSLGSTMKKNPTTTGLSVLGAGSAVGVGASSRRRNS